MGIIHPITEELRAVPCHAGEPIGDVLGSRLPNTPGVRCRITHETLDVDRNAPTLIRFCCNPCAGVPFGDDLGKPAGYTACPVWQFDRERVWRGRHSFGDEREMQRQNERTYREDLTGSEFGDVEFMRVIDDAVDESMAAQQALARGGLMTRLEEDL